MRKRVISCMMAAMLMLTGVCIHGQAKEVQKVERSYATITTVDGIIRRPIVFEPVTPIYRNIGDYYYASVAMEVSATMSAKMNTRAAGASTKAAIMNKCSGINAEIKDWGQAVFAGSDVSVSLAAIPGRTAASTPGFLSYQWEFYNKDGVYIGKASGSLVTVPQAASGGYLLVKASVLRANNGWAASSTTSYVTVS